MKSSIIFSVLLTLAACSSSTESVITIENPSALLRQDEMVEIDLAQLTGCTSAPDGEFVLLDEEKQEVPYQLTYDGKLIFPVTVAASGRSVYTVKKGKPTEVPTFVCGRLYPERLDDMAWENDKAAYRTYGPALQKTGERGFGYDIWTKSVAEPVVEERYRMELDTAARAQIRRWRKEGLKERADSLSRAISYHLDHGTGMDCYNVGPTLGGGTAALMLDSTLLYPYCFQDYEVLDNGPLRFTVRLTYPTVSYEKLGEVTETRLISLDKGSYLNHTEVYYKQLEQSLPIAVGIVLHPQNPDGYYYNQEQGIIAYADSTNSTTAGNGVIYVGAVVPQSLTEATVRLFDKEEQKQRPGALGHVLAISNYSPENGFTYYWGSSWSKGGMPSEEAWQKDLELFRQKLNQPMKITIK